MKALIENDENTGYDFDYCFDCIDSFCFNFIRFLLLFWEKKVVKNNCRKMRRNLPAPQSEPRAMMVALVVEEEEEEEEDQNVVANLVAEDAEEVEEDVEDVDVVDLFFLHFDVIVCVV